MYNFSTFNLRLGKSKISRTKKCPIRKTNVSLKTMKIIVYPTNFVSVWLIWGWRMLVTKIFDLDLRMIELWAKIRTLRMGQKGDITLDLPGYSKL